MQIIPLTNDFAQKFSTVLNDQEVDIRVWWQDIGEGWFFSMSETNSDDIVNGFRIENGSPIMTSVVSDFIGDIVCIATIEKTAEPGKEQPWGNTHKLIYLTPDEAEFELFVPLDPFVEYLSYEDVVDPDAVIGYDTVTTL